jgi:hypothetical protein
MLWLNPSDNQGVRFLIDEVRARTAWKDRAVKCVEQWLCKSETGSTHFPARPLYRQVRPQPRSSTTGNYGYSREIAINDLRSHAKTCRGKRVENRV